MALADGTVVMTADAKLIRGNLDNLQKNHFGVVEFLKSSVHSYDRANQVH